MTTATLPNRTESTFKRLGRKVTEYKIVIMELTKFRITFFVAVTTFVGFILYSGTIDQNFILPTLGVLILASGASALNEYQEREFDSKMKRTSLRPIPSGRITPNYALLLSFFLVLLGSLVLALQSLTVLLLGLFTLVWYNGVYTPLKKVNSLAILPGSLVGALPPMIGWAAAGGSIFDIRILSFALFMFIWQIPHFWLLVLIYDEQYKKAGFPTLSKLFSFDAISKITFGWIVIMVLSSSLIYYSELSNHLISQLLLIISGIITVYFSFSIIKEKNREIFKKSFLLINSYVLFILIVISVENII